MKTTLTESYSKEELKDIEEIRRLLKLPFTIERKLYRMEYVNRSENSNKFYELWIKPTKEGHCSLVAKWGRIGSSGQTKVYFTGPESACQANANKILNKKVKEGYKVIQASH